MAKKIAVLNGLRKVHFFHLFAESIVAVFLTLYIWKTADIQAVIWFRLLELLFIVFATVFVGFFIDKVSAKFSLAFGVLLFFIQLIGVAILQENIVQYLLLLAGLSGVSSVFRFLSLNVINQNVVEEKSQTRYFANLSIDSRLISIIFPIFSGLIIYFFGYSPVFVLALISLGVLFFYLYKTPMNISKNPYKPLATFKKFNKEKAVLFVVNLLWGIEFGLFATIIPIAVSIMMKGELGWGIFTTFLGIIAIGYSNFLKNRKLVKVMVSLLTLIALFLASTAIIFATNVSLISFIIFMIFLQLWQTTQRVGLLPIFYKIITEESHASFMTTEYNVFMQIPYIIGRFFILGLLFIIGNGLESMMILGFLFAALSFIPFYEGKLITVSKQSGFKKI